MTVTTTMREGVLVAEPMGPRLDAADAQAFRDQVADRLSQGSERLVMNLGRVDFIDSSGLTALISILKLMGKGGRMAICCLGVNPLALFKLTRLDRLFPIYGDEDEAVRALAG